MGMHSGGPDGPYQHQPADQYEAPGQHQPSRKRHTGRNVLLGIGGALVVILGITFAALAIGASGPPHHAAVGHPAASQTPVPQPTEVYTPDPLQAWQDGRGHALYQKVLAHMQHLNSDAAAGNSSALPADGKTLERAALAASRVPCPADRYGYKLEMTATGLAGIALELDKDNLAGSYLKKVTALTSSVNAACGF